MKNRDRLNVTERVADLRRCQVVYIALDVPTGPDGEADLLPVRELIDQVETTIEDRIFVVLSQVPPGFMRGLSIPAERRFYQVETLIFGRAVDRAVYPERIILGCADPSRDLPAPLADFLHAFECPVLRMRYESAELAKLAINMYLSASVCTTNTLAELCEQIGADWTEIVPALRLDKRIGPHAYLTPGLGIAGGNLERDLAAVVGLSRTTGTDASVIESFRRHSRYRSDWALRMLHARLSSGKEGPLGILGLAYKEDTHSTKNSASLALIKHLGPWRLRVYDPVVSPTVIEHPHVTGCPSALEAARGTQALLVMTPWAEFRELTAPDLAHYMEGRTIIDPYHVLEGRALTSAGFDYLTLGARPVSASPSPQCSNI